jgi:hypothetical protein
MAACAQGSTQMQGSLRGIVQYRLCTHHKTADTQVVRQYGHRTGSEQASMCCNSCCNEVHGSVPCLQHPRASITCSSLSAAAVSCTRACASMHRQCTRWTYRQQKQQQQQHSSMCLINYQHDLTRHIQCVVLSCTSGSVYHQGSCCWQVLCIKWPATKHITTDLP